ncbi:hypothetical protein [Agrobacterium radiobacter]|uniref:hypothetical protein n=1 Tax=Agrobacterium radiobacter TaxID=362 RepID=UPI003C30E1AE
MTEIEKPYFRVKLSEQLVESMTLAALEAYVLGDQSSRRNREKVETLGYIWGVKKVENGSTTLFLDRMSVASRQREVGARFSLISMPQS